VSALGERFTELLERHREIIRGEFRRFDGTEVNTEGDSFFAVFQSAANAIAAAVATQRSLAAEGWPDGLDLRVRIGLHTGLAQVVQDDYVGLEVHRAARVMAAANGGQILVSDATRSLAMRELDRDIEWRDLGERALRDLAGRERLFRVWAPGMPDDNRPARTLETAPNNLPVQASTLIGRGEERAALHELVESDAVRLLTLVGPGGIGKTRLALQTAADHIDFFPDGVYFVDLAAAHEEDAALRTIAVAIGAGTSDEPDVRQTLTNALRGRRVLVVLDNFEQVMAAARDVAALIAQCAELKVIVTSREALRVRGEQLFRVQPLSVPDSRARTMSAERASQYEAVRLFVDRAQLAAPDFQLSDANARVVADVCVQLDGLPLAIELATARLRIFSVDELRERLNTRLDVLRGGARDLPERQRTLRGTIEWSYELLDEDERSVLGVLSIFPDARIEAVEEVCGTMDSLADIDVVERLASLVDKSLVRRSVDGRDERLTMLNTIRDYASERLDEEPALADNARSAHAHFYAAFAERQTADLRSSGRQRALAQLGADLGNLQIAWVELVSRDEMTSIRRLFDPLWTVLEALGWYREAIGLVNDLLGVLGKVPPDPTHADKEVALRMSLGRGLLALKGYTNEVEQIYQDALALANESLTPRSSLVVLRSLASYHLYRAELPKTLTIGLQMLDIAAAEKDATIEMEGHVIAGPSAAFLGDGNAGLAHLDKAIELFDPERDGVMKLRMGANPGIVAHAIAGLLRWEFGYPEMADRHATAGRELAVRIGHPYSLAYVAFHTTFLDYWNGRMESVAKGAEEVLKVAEEHEYRVWKALAHVLAGVAESALGDANAGVERAEKGIALYEDLNSPPVFWPLVLGLRARAHENAGRLQVALGYVQQSIEIGGEASVTQLTLLVQRADLEAFLGNRVAARATLENAIEIARSMQVRMEELRAATRLVRLADVSDSRQLLALRDIYDQFSEGFDTAPLREAAAVLAPLPTRA
jgi:predicted ATPase